MMLVQAAPTAAQDFALQTAPEEASAPAEPSEPIPLESPDADIARRLAGIYAGIDGLERVRVQVRDGVVTLSGTTLDGELRAKAEDVAGRLAGVVSVENAITAEHRVDRRLQPVIDKAEQMLRDTLTFLPLLAVALIVFVAFWFLGRLLTNRLKPFRRLAPNAFIEALLEQIVRFLFGLIGLVLAMSILGATALLGSVLGAAGVLGLAVGFAVRDTIENYIASLLLSVRQPFAPNDHVIIEGYEGRITRLNSRATVIMTFDGNEVRIPNATVYKAIITNFTRTPERRFDFEVGIGNENDIACALAIALKTVKAVDGVLADPGPFVQVDRLGDFTVVIKVFGWANQQTSDWGKVKSEAIRQVKEAFDAAGISMPEPIQNVRQLPDAPPAALKPAAPPQPSAADQAESADTSADHTIRQKVEETRATGERDLLSHAAAQE